VRNWLTPPAASSRPGRHARDFSTGRAREFFAYNAVGHTVALTDNNGAVKESNLYEAYGGVVVSTGSSQNNRLANTKERDFSVGLDNHGKCKRPPTSRAGMRPIGQPICLCFLAVSIRSALPYARRSADFA
jgi:hypothetical protein